MKQECAYLLTVKVMDGIHTLMAPFDHSHRRAKNILAMEVEHNELTKTKSLNLTKCCFRLIISKEYQRAVD